MKLFSKKRFIKIVVVLLVIGAVVGAGFLITDNGHVSASETKEAEQPQAMPVDVVTIQPEKIQIWKNFSGHVVAVDRAEIRPQVSGRITEILFEDGQHVEKGSVLTIIDPRPYEAALSQAKALMEAANAQALLAEKEYQRAKSLIETEAIAQSLMDERTNKKNAAAAAVLGAQAAVESAEINLDYAHVKAPISGKVSRAEITVGNLVQAGANAPLLTSIVADEKMYVDFEVDEKTYLDSAQHGSDVKDSGIPVRLQLTSGQEYQGYVHSFDNRIDPASGTIRARAVFENSDKNLLPGMSVSVLMGGAGDSETILVSERAIGTDQNRKFVYTVSDGVAAYNEITIGESINGRRVVLSGLNKGDVVVTEGLVRIRPGVPVTPKVAAIDHATDQTDDMTNMTPAAGAEETHQSEEK